MAATGRTLTAEEYYRTYIKPVEECIMDKDIREQIKDQMLEKIKQTSRLVDQREHITAFREFIDALHTEVLTERQKKA